MEQITVRLPDELLAELDDIAEESNRSRAEVIRDELDSPADAPEVERLRTEYEALKDEYGQETEYLRTQIERLQRTNLKVLEQRDQNTELERYVDDSREWKQASWLTRQKWRLFGKA